MKYMDFSLLQNPPSKEPMILLLKQARAYGIGVILSTQNPVDLDYKGLSNMGTWFIGRLQTTQDVNRVIDGLGGKVGSSYDKDEIRNLLSNMKKRTFFLKSARLDDIRIFGTRWVMSYLKGPLKRDEISDLMAAQKSQLAAISAPEKQAKEEAKASKPDGYENYSNLDESIPQYYQPDLSQSKQYVATLMADCSLNFFNQSRGIDEEENYCLCLELDPTDRNADWDNAINDEDASNCIANLPINAPEDAQYAETPEFLNKDKHLRSSKKSLVDWLYHEHELELFRCKSPKLESNPYELLGDFKTRITDALNDKKEQAIEVLQERYGKKEKVLMDRLDRYLLSVKK